MGSCKLNLTTELLIIVSQSVETLDLKQYEISSGVAVDVFTSLEHNTSLVELDLSGNSQLERVIVMQWVVQLR